MQIDLRVSQLLCSRLCHDLVGASGAVSAGLELMAELGLADPDAENSLAMTAGSAAQMANRLGFFRMALGSGGGKGGPPLRDAAEVAMAYLGDYGVGLDFPAAFDGVDAAGVSADGARLVLNMVLMAKESLPRGGTVTVRLGQLDGGVGVAVTAAGRGAALRDAARAALAPGFPAAELTPHTVQAYFTQALAASLDTALEADAETGEVRLAALLKAI